MNRAEYETMRQVEEVHWWYRGLRSMLGRMIPVLPQGTIPTVLDAGCGTGANLRFLCERLQRARFIALDASPHALRHIQSSENVTVLAGDVNTLPLPDGSIDLVLAADLLGQTGVVVPLAAGHFHRVLKPGGVVLANVPAFPWLHGEHDRAVQVGKRFTPGELPSALRKAGFQEVEERFWNLLALPPMMARRFISRRNESCVSAPRSDLTLTPSWLNPVLACLITFETEIASRLPLPCGSSLFVVARKPGALAPFTPHNEMIHTRYSAS